MANYTDGELKTIIRDVVREAKRQARIDTGYLKRSIRGDIFGKNRVLEFRQVVYGVYNENSKLVEIAEKMIPKDIQWRVILEDEDGNETQAKGVTRTGRKVRRSSIGNLVNSTFKIKALIDSFKRNGKKDSTTEANRGDD